MSTLQVALRIVLFFLSAIFYGICSTPPHPTPKGSMASTPSGLREWFVVIRIRYVLPLQKIGFYTAALNECIHIVAHRDIANVSLNSLFVVAAFFSIFGGLIRFLCYRELGECFTFELVPAGQNAISPSVAQNPKLITTGPYSYVRHPSYLGLWMCFFGSTMVHMVRGSWMRESGFLDTLIGRLITMMITQNLEVLAKTSLILASAVSFGVSFTPPNGGPKSLPPRPPITKALSQEMREWVLVFLIKYALPIEVRMYYLISFNEIVHVISSSIPSLPIRPYFPYHVSPHSFSNVLIIGSLLSTAGCILRIFCYRALAEGFTFELVPAGKLSNNPSLVKSPKLVTHGPYSIVRHPSYLGSWFNFVGSAMVHSWIFSDGSDSAYVLRGLAYAWLMGVGGGITVLLMRMGDEDALMKKQFGTKWEEWRKNVRYRVIPGVY
ncbi:hypothetical protein VNI00_007311 [Paramarasmius palmivorus]|uniref:Protein-S-isoprenylcysteine O-methyltransferase n=1 Tax=Paramarasmius palmivorus TaxID=297713 RepID=A0AAW0D0T2_9AGAR